MGFESFCILELKKKLQEVSFKSGFLMDNLNVALTWRWEDLTLTSRWYSWGLFHLILGYQYEQNDKYNSGKLPSRTHIVFSTIWGNTSEANQKPICRWRNNREIRWPDQGHRAGSGRTMPRPILSPTSLSPQSCAARDTDHMPHTLYLILPTQWQGPRVVIFVLPVPQPWRTKTLRG